MIRQTFLAAASVAAFAFASPAAARPMTATDMHMMHRLGTPEVSPDGKWALALRMRRAIDDSAVERAFAAGRILRTHVMRPTWHFVARDDIRWLLELTAARVDLRCGPGYRMFELDDQLYRYDVVTVVLPPDSTPQIELIRNYWTF